MFLTNTSDASRSPKSTLVHALCVFIFGAICLDAPRAQTGDDANVRSSVDDYLDAIDRVEAMHSAYATELSDLYMGLGRALIDENNYPEAQRALHRGMQVERVNYGLDSISQTPYLLLLADLDAAAGDDKASQEALEGIYQISAKNYGYQDSRMLTTLDQMLAWQLQKYRDKPPRKAFSHILAVERLAARMAGVVQSSLPVSDPRAPSYFAKLAAIQYLIADHIDRHGAAPKASFAISAGPAVHSQSRGSTSFTYYRRGKSALLHRVDAVMQQSQDDPLIQAAAIADLADWYLVFGQTQAAIGAYRLAFETLIDDDISEDVRNTFFSQPKKIQFQLEDNPTDAGQQSLQVGIWITATGRPKDIEVIDPPDELSEQDIEQMRDALRDDRYRPRLNEGVPEAMAHRVSYRRPEAPAAEQG
ncbi:MAG: hypothetical protein OSA42_01615 [Porticoccaceae bacterium]|nr:hypothetical protein [Porticoccaceae bacterium]